MELKDISLYFIVGVVFIIASWLISYVLRVILYPLWLVAAFCIGATATGWLVITVAKKVAGLK